MTTNIHSESASVAAPDERGAELERAVARNPAAFRVLTGDRPTGPLHIGHYFGTLANRVRLQQLGVELLVLIADYQTITDRDAPDTLPREVEGLVADYLAVGIDPDRAIIFTHSQIAELNELLIPFLSLVSVAELGRNPTVKDEIARTKGNSTSALMFTYPVHQAADILFCRANLVPVGKDQLPHLELARTIARRFNERYSPCDLYFPQPEGLLSQTPLVLGLDGQKMGKSRGNAVPLGVDDDETARLIRRANTDSERRITYEPERRPEVANLLRIAALCLNRSPQQIADEIGDRGALTLKDLVTDALNAHLRPVRARREDVADERDYLRSILRVGNERARELAAETLSAVHRLMHADYSQHSSADRVRVARGSR
jgi:tryptophanyl-tRNA synthetase